MSKTNEQANIDHTLHLTNPNLIAEERLNMICDLADLLCCSATGTTTAIDTPSTLYTTAATILEHAEALRAGARFTSDGLLLSD